MIVLYDFHTDFPGRCISPFIWRARTCLNYKGIPHRTEWVEFCDIEEFSKKLGVEAAGKKPDGTPRYTLPAIHDPSTNTTVADSFRIAQYLDATYPDTPSLLHGNTDALQVAFAASIMPFLFSVIPFLGPLVWTRLGDRSRLMYRERIEKRANKSVDEITPRGEARVEAWNAVKTGLSGISEFLDTRRSGTEKPWVMGDTVSFADAALGGGFMWMRTVWGEDSDEWKDIMGCDNGRWKVFLEAMDGLGLLTVH